MVIALSTLGIEQAHAGRLKSLELLLCAVMFEYLDSQLIQNHQKHCMKN